MAMNSANNLGPHGPDSGLMIVSTDGLNFSTLTPVGTVQNVIADLTQTLWLPKIIAGPNDQFDPHSVAHYLNYESVKAKIDLKTKGLYSTKKSWLNEKLMPLLETTKARWTLTINRVFNSELTVTPNLAPSTVMGYQQRAIEIVAERFGKDIVAEEEDISTEEGRLILQQKLVAIAGATANKIATITYAAIVNSDRTDPAAQLTSIVLLEQFVELYQRYKTEFGFFYKGDTSADLLVSRYGEILKERTENETTGDYLIIPPTYSGFMELRSPLQYAYGTGGPKAAETLDTHKLKNVGSFTVAKAPGILDDDARVTIQSTTVTRTRVGSYTDFSVDRNRRRSGNADPMYKFEDVKQYPVGAPYDTDEDQDKLFTVSTCMNALSTFFRERGDGTGYDVIAQQNTVEHAILQDMQNRNAAFRKAVSPPTGQPIDVEAFLDLVVFVAISPCETQMMDSVHLVGAKGAIGNAILLPTTQGVDKSSVTGELTYTFRKRIGAFVNRPECVIKIPNQLFAGYICGKNTRIVSPANFGYMRSTNYSDTSVKQCGSMFMMFALKSDFNAPDFIFANSLKDFSPNERTAFYSNVFPNMALWMQYLQLPDESSIPNHYHTCDLPFMLFHNGMDKYYMGILGNRCESQTHVQFERPGTRAVRNVGVSLLPKLANL